MRKLVRLCGLSVLLSGVAAAQTTYTAAQDAAAFGARESVTAIDLSPDGSRIAFIGPSEDGYHVGLTADLSAGTSAAFLKTGKGTDRLSWCRFVTNERLICRYSSIAKSEGMLIGFSRLVAVGRDGSNRRELGQSSSAYDAVIRQVDGSIVDWLPDAGGAVLMARQYIAEEGKSDTRLVRKKSGLGVDRLNTMTLKATTIEQPRVDAADYLSDGRGVVRVMRIEENTNSGYLTGRSRYLYRTAQSREWRQLSGYVDDDAYQPLAIDARTNSLYVLKPLDGRRALYRIALTDTPTAEPVASHPRVDIDEIVLSTSGRDVIGYAFAEERREVVYFDAQANALVKSMARALKNLPLIRIVDASLDGNKVLIFAGSDRDAGRYYLFDKQVKRLNEIMLVRPELENRALAEVRPVTVKTPDGIAMPAYLTMPNGSAAKNLPAVVLPHGGPSARDEWGFDWLAQFLAARGYAVLQPNFRGSAGYGDEWLVENGFQGWKTSIGDVTASARWLVEQGIADPSRLAIVGWSYGGYAALQSAATDPGLFKAVVAIAPVTDLALLKTEFDNYTVSQVVARFVGSGPHVTEGSPLRRASAMRAPVLLVHGDRDQNVGVLQSAKMAAALRENGVPVEFLRFEGLDHQLDDANARRSMLERVAALLERTIGR